MSSYGFYRCIRRSFLIVGGVAFRLRIRGREHIPTRGPAILVAAHRSWLDPACVGAACPRPVRFLILRRVYDVPVLRRFYAAMRSLPVDPATRSSVASLRRAMAHLREGGVVGVFPEGRVVPEGQQVAFQQGAALLALRSGAPVVPVHIDGSARAWPHRRWPRPARVSIRVGRAIEVPASADRTRDDVAHIAERIRQAIENREGAA